MNKKTDNQPLSVHPSAADDKIKKEAEEWKAKYLRALADYQNLEKRVTQMRQDMMQNALESVIVEFLPVIDVLEKAEKHINDQGLTLGLKSFWNVLSGKGVRRLETKGKRFDPNEMECVEVVGDGKDDNVIEELLPGYKLGDKVIRVAKVKVGRKTENKEQIIENKNVK